MNIFEALRADHDKQRTLVELLCKTHGDSRGRNELLPRLKSALQSHAAAEERHFYLPLMKDDRSQDRARHAIAEHHELISQLEDTDMSSSAWLAHARKLHERLTHHLEEEEHEFFQMAGKVLTDGQKEALASSYHEQMNSESNAA